MLEWFRKKTGKTQDERINALEDLVRKQSFELQSIKNTVNHNNTISRNVARRVALLENNCISGADEMSKYLFKDLK